MECTTSNGKSTGNTETTKLNGDNQSMSSNRGRSSSSSNSNYKNKQKSESRSRARVRGGLLEAAVGAILIAVKSAGTGTARIRFTLLFWGAAGLASQKNLHDGFRDAWHPVFGESGKWAPPEVKDKLKWGGIGFQPKKWKTKKLNIFERPVVERWVANTLNPS